MGKVKSVRGSNGKFGFFAKSTKGAFEAESSADYATPEAAVRAGQDEIKAVEEYKRDD